MEMVYNKPSHAMQYNASYSSKPNKTRNNPIPANQNSNVPSPGDLGLH